VTQEHFIIEFFCREDDMPDQSTGHLQAKLSLGELVTPGWLTALRGCVAAPVLPLV